MTTLTDVSNTLFPEMLEIVEPGVNVRSRPLANL